MKVNLIFRNFDGNGELRFVEAEDLDGYSVKVGQWIELDDEYIALQLDVKDENGLG